MSLAGSVCFNVPQIAGMPIARVWRAVLLVRRVKMATGRAPIAGRAITEFVNVKTVFAWC